MTIPVTGDVLIDVLMLLTVEWVVTILLLPVGQWIAYKRDCKKIWQRAGRRNLEKNEVTEA